MQSAFATRFIRAIACGIVSLALVACGGNDDGPPLVATTNGPVSGASIDSMQRYLGIPFAAPPVGSLRWMPPQAPQKWTAERPAVNFGPSCAQNRLWTFSPRSVSEDCLYLNVYTPTAASDEKRPVMVWIYGGGLGAGRTNDYDPQFLVNKGNVVLVSINYRVGPFGFLAHPGLDAEGHDIGNYGLMDQQFALKWVRDNIEKFGGDPANVTIFGESAGGASVFMHVASPVSKGLFHKAITQSGTMFGSPFQALFGGLPLPVAEGLGIGVAATLGCTVPTDAKCMRAASTEAVLSAYGSLGNNGFLPGMAVVDGTILKQSVAQALSAGNFNRVPMINGGNRDEWTWMIGMEEILSGHVLQPSELEDALRIFFTDVAPTVAARYPVANYGGSGGLARANAETDSFFTCPLLNANDTLSAAGAPVWGYYFTEKTAPVPFPKASFPYGVAHTLEMQYLFKNFVGAEGTPVPLTRENAQLSDEMVSYWTTFARNGDPNSASSTSWPRYDSSKKYLELATPARKVINRSDIDAAHNCTAFWNGLNVPR